MPIMSADRARAARARRRALELAAADEEAFEGVWRLYRLPRDTDSAKAERVAAIQLATQAAARPPLAVAEIAASVVELAAQLPGRSKSQRLVGRRIAASLAVAALESSAVNVEVNLATLPDGPARSQLRQQLANQLAAAARGRQLVAEVRATLSS